MVDRWREYFDTYGAFDGNWLKSAVTHWGFHEILYGMIQRHCVPPGKILDVGCGPGWSDFYLASLGYEVLGVDNEPALVDLAVQQSRQLNTTATFQVADAFNLSHLYGRFDLAYSCGVLEHFDRDVTIQLLKEQAKCAKRVLIQIPTKYTALSDGITDERIYTMSQLKKIVREAGLNIEAAFGYGDLTVTRGQIWLRRFLPRALWRELQNRGYCFSIAVLAVRDW